MKSEKDFRTYYSNLDPVARQAISSCSEQSKATAGETIIEKGTESDSVFLIEDGVVEVLIETPGSTYPIPLAYLGKDNIIGELGVLNNKPRSATIRAAVDVHYRRIEKGNFLRLLRDTPGFGLYISYRLAERLANTTANLACTNICFDLNGKLPDLDPLSVFNTLSNQPNSIGELTILDENKTPIGSFFIDKTTLKEARFRHLQGIEAFWQIFFEHHMTGTTYSFVEADKPSQSTDPIYHLSAPLTPILMEATIKRDEFQQLKSSWKELRYTLRRTNLQPAWNETSLESAVQQLWKLTRDTWKDLSDIWHGSNLSQLSLILITRQMVEQKYFEIEATR